MEENNDLMRLRWMALIMVLLAFLLVSCQGVIDTPIEIGNGYFCDNGLYLTKENYANGRAIDIIVPDKITRINYDSSFIIIEHRPNKKAYLFETSGGDSALVDSIMSVYLKCEHYGLSYWIIDMKTHMRLGPYSHEDFLKMKDSLLINLEFNY